MTRFEELMLRQLLSRDYPTIIGSTPGQTWKFEYDGMTGGLMYRNPQSDVQVWCTPDYDGAEDCICICVDDGDGDILHHDNIDWPDMVRSVESFVSAIRPLLEREWITGPKCRVCGARDCSATKCWRADDALALNAAGAR